MKVHITLIENELDRELVLDAGAFLKMFACAPKERDRYTDWLKDPTEPIKIHEYEISGINQLVYNIAYNAYHEGWSITEDNRYKEGTLEYTSWVAGFRDAHTDDMIRNY